MGQVGLSPTVRACVCNFLIVFLPSKRRGQIITFREATQDYVVACNPFSAIALLKYRESLVNYSGHPAKWQGLRLNSHGSKAHPSLFMHVALINANII